MSQTSAAAVTPTVSSLLTVATLGWVIGLGLTGLIGRLRRQTTAVAVRRALAASR